MAQERRRWIEVRGAREHNLRGIDVRIPGGCLTVVTGVSGSGKSSLAFDTVFREGQRRYLAALSPHARQFLDRQHRPDADHFTGLPAALAVDQKTTVRNPRSTVGTLTEVYDHLRLLYARISATSGDAPAGVGTHTFSFNSAAGACPDCNGLAVTDRVDPSLLIADPSKSLRGGALVPTTKSGYIVYSQVTIDVLDDVCRAHGFDVDTPWEQLTPDQHDVIFHGSDRIEVPFGKHTLESRMRWSGITARPRETGFYKGLMPTITETLTRNRNQNILRFVRSVACATCDGTRLGALGRSVEIQGDSIVALARRSLTELRRVLASWTFDGAQDTIATPILAAITHRLDLLIELGLGYLRLERASTSLSGGEAQRIRLASQVGSGLHGLLYVLDEPSIGLHSVDCAPLLRVLRRLRDLGNTVLCVEHDGATIAAADWLVDLGPGAGAEGGAVLFAGDPRTDARRNQSPTLTWLRETPPALAPTVRSGTGATLTVRGATAHNLNDIDATFRLGAFNVVTGVSGAGKSTLVDHVLARALRAHLHGARTEPGAHRDLDGVEHVTRVLHIDQAPIGRTPRSNPATYTGALDPIRDLFAAQDGAVERSLGKGHFSMNVAAGRCEECQGAGRVVLGMHGLADVEISCAQCGGRRFQDAVLAVRYRDHDIAQVLDLSVDEALTVFAGHDAITRILRAMQDLGLGYIRLGQSATTFSGGEAQRIKLATELSKPVTRGHAIYILDEPTTGLHARDVAVLVAALHGLIDSGHTVVVIEHDLDVVRIADHVVDLGPGAGDDGGRVVFAGSPTELVGCEASATGRALAAYLRDGWAADGATPAAAAAAPPSHIRFAGVRTNNLRGIDVAIPHRALTVLTGVSGSGKSSLAFDTVFAEGRRRFAENLTTQARRHLPTHTTARFDTAHGLTPTIALAQRRSRSPDRRSTVGTLSGIHDHYRLLFSRAGTPRGGCSASMFSFHHQAGACPVCGGHGFVESCDPDKLVTHPERSLFDGAMDGHKTGRFYGERDGQHLAILAAVERQLGVDLHRPYCELEPGPRELAMSGTGAREYEVTWKFQRKTRSGEHTFRGTFLGFAGYVDEEFARKRLDRRGDAMRVLLSEQECSACGGARLRPAPRAVQFGGLTLPELCARSVTASLEFFGEALDTALDAETAAIAAQPRAEIRRRLQHLQDLGLGHLALDRPVATLSGGELQRTRIATQLGTRLAGITYVLDEPTVGLHPHDTAQLIDALRQLLADDCTVVVVEHDAQVWNAADHVIAMGPGAGAAGGTITVTGPPSAVPAPMVPELDRRPLPASEPIRIRGARRHNLAGLDVDVPTQCLVAISGVSGSGKSSLGAVITASVEQGHAVDCDGVEGIQTFAEVVRAERHPIGNTPASMPVTYAGLFDRIRKLFATTDAAKGRGLKPAAFSLQTKAAAGGGRCEACEGHGAIRTSLDFLPDVWHPCETCNGKRYAAATLECTLDHRSIAEVLAMPAQEALAFFAGERAIRTTLQHVVDVGLGYLPLGQPGNTLSGGEAQRLHLATELGRGTAKGHRLYLFDEPTRGLHADDVGRLLAALRTLTELGHSVLVIEHNVDVIRNADQVLDLGPGGGEDGGNLIYAGPPAGLATCPASRTAAFVGTVSDTL